MKNIYDDKKYYQNRLKDMYEFSAKRSNLSKPKLILSFGITFSGLLLMRNQFEESNPLLDCTMIASGIFGGIEIMLLIFDQLTRLGANLYLRDLAKLIEKKGARIDNDNEIIYEEDGSIHYIDADGKEFDITEDVKKVVDRSASKKNKK